MGGLLTLEALRPGDTFRLRDTPARTGVLLGINRCSARIVWDGTDRTATVQGRTFTVHADAIEVAPATRVVRVGHVNLGTDIKFEKEEAMSNGQLRMRWLFQVGQLRLGLKRDDEALIEAARERIAVLAVEAHNKGIRMPRPAMEPMDSVFEAKAVMAVLETIEEQQHRDALLEQARGGTRAKRGPNGPQPKKAKGTPVRADGTMPKASRTNSGGQSACLCGCGKTTGGRFFPGHDATYKSLILKIERGEMKPAALSAKMQAELRFEKKAGVKGLWCTNPQAKVPGH